MRNIYKDIVFIAIIFLLGIYIVLNLFKDDHVTFIYNHDDLYDKALKYLIDHDDNPNKNKYEYKKFIYYDGFGIAENKDYRYAYMWIITDSCYIENNKIVRSFGHSVPYKFVFNKKDKVIKYLLPEEGREYSISIKNMYPKEIQNKIFHYKANDTLLEEEIQSYYEDKIVDRS